MCLALGGAEMWFFGGVTTSGCASTASQYLDSCVFQSVGKFSEGSKYFDL